MKALAPEHLEDLRRSGLSDQTIAALGFEAIRPQDIKLQGVTSAYRIPHYTLEGTVNCAERLKLFPALTRAGGTQKYFQAPGSPPSLYLPPLCSWSTIAHDSVVPLLLVEGEKKSAAACQHGLSAIGVAGVWNWRQRLDSGERIVIPTLDQFVWRGRSVELVPDSDAWGEHKQLAVLSGFFALGQELLSRGASVRLLKLPEHAVKVGLDDWLVAVGADWTHQWSHLERFALDAPPLAPMAAWWQSWREKQATHTALAARNAPEMRLTETAGEYTVVSLGEGVRFVFDRLVEQRGGISAELSVYMGDGNLLSGIDIGLKSDTSQSKLASSLTRLVPAMPWKLLLQKSCALVKQHHREGTLPRYISKHSPAEALTYTVNPLIVKHAGNIVYGDGVGASAKAPWGYCVPS